MKKTDEIYVKTTLPDSGIEVSVLDLKGKHFFQASSLAIIHKDINNISKYLVHCACLINGKKIELEYIDEMSLCDYMHLNEIINKITNKLDF